MTVLALIRHGQTEWNRQGRIQGVTDVPLNPTGMAQATEAAARLMEHPMAPQWFGVVTSPLSRAQVTGQVIATELGIPLMPSMRGLTERDYGACEGFEMEAAKELYPSGEYPESESNDSVFVRALSSIDDLRSQYSRPLIVVAHGGLFHTLLSRLNGARLPSIVNAAVNLVEYVSEPDRWVIHAINGKPHRSALPTSS